MGCSSYNQCQDWKQVLGDAALPLILMTGTPRSGKSSILEVIFEKKQPAPTNTEPTLCPRLWRVNVPDMISYYLLVLPYHFCIDQKRNAEILRKILERTSLLWHVLDPLVGNIGEELEFLSFTWFLCIKYMRSKSFYCFIHKADSRPRRTEQDQEVFVNRLMDRIISDHNMERSNGSKPIFVFTSIYDASVSRHVSTLVKELLGSVSKTITSLCDILGKKCGSELVSIVDMKTGLSYGEGTIPIQNITFELNSEIREMSNVLNLLMGESMGSTSVRLQNGYSFSVFQMTEALGISFVSKKELCREVFTDYNVNLFRTFFFEALSLHKTRNSGVADV